MAHMDAATRIWHAIKRKQEKEEAERKKQRERRSVEATLRKTVVSHKIPESVLREAAAHEKKMELDMPPRDRI